ncbi:unnamed protein product [Gulo gulo]|uniref:Uncharacterized protein n=1 Tax=Gulo gulo TaxID=48420 RepID=A0A9X9PW49_GULGU|nr:unnamed protein product [Gulo gulo]
MPLSSPPPSIPQVWSALPWPLHTPQPRPVLEGPSPAPIHHLPAHGSVPPPQCSPPALWASLPARSLRPVAPSSATSLPSSHPPLLCCCPCPQDWPSGQSL